MRNFLSARRYPALLTLLSMGILAVGVLLKPRQASPEAVVSESETMRLQQMAQKRRLREMAAFSASIAQSAAAHVIYVRQAGAAGIVWTDQGDVVTPGPAPAGGTGGTVLLPDGREAPAQWRHSGGPVGTVRITGADALASIRAAHLATPEGASWVIQVGRHRDGSLFFTPGMYIGTQSVACGGAGYQEIYTTIELTPAMAGGGLFDLDGQLLGVIARCGDRLIVLPPPDVERARRTGSDVSSEREWQWGMRLTALDQAAHQYFRSPEGLLVNEVRSGGRADRSGLQPGDIVKAVNEERIASVEGFWKALENWTESTRVEVVRHGRKRLRPLAGPEPLAPAPAAAESRIGIQLEMPPEGYRIESVAADSAAARAGIRTGDRLLKVNGTRVRRAGQLTALLKRSGGGPDYLLVSRGDRQIGILLP